MATEEELDRKYCHEDEAEVVLRGVEVLTEAELTLDSLRTM